VIFPHYVLSNIPEYFPKPSEFLPERWMKNTDPASHEGCPAHQHKIHPFASLPFSFGRRTCLGKRFAYLELHILLSKVSKPP
jgi:cytochrome P450 family 49 subfamily A